MGFWQVQSLNAVASVEGCIGIGMGHTMTDVACCSRVCYSLPRSNQPSCQTQAEDL